MGLGRLGVYQMAAIPSRATDPVATIHQRHRDRSAPGPAASGPLNLLPMNGRLSGSLIFCGCGVRFTPEDESGQLVSGRDIRGAAFVQVRSQQRRTYARSVVDQLRKNPLASLRFWIADRLYTSKGQ